MCEDQRKDRSVENARRESPVISVQDVSVAFENASTKSLLQVTDGVSFDIFPGEFFSLVGESGCGKSVTAMSVLRLLPWPSAKIVSGKILFDGAGDALCDLVSLPMEKLQSVRGSEIACIFQEPMQALNPVVTIKKQLLEVFKYGASRRLCEIQAEYAKNQPIDIVRNQLRLAGFTDPDRVLDSYPHELSGGMLQRVCIVMALLPKPKLIIADEPTTALDVTVQAQVLKILKDMAEQMGTAVLLITHNMGIVSQYANRVAVMYAGRIVEEGAVREVINHPMHPYTQGLLAAIPESHSEMKNLRAIPGTVPHPKDFVAGCRFADRCDRCTDVCRTGSFPTKKSAADVADHIAYCFNV